MRLVYKILVKYRTGGHLEDLHKDRKTLKWILTEVGFQGLDWIFVAQVACCKHSHEHIRLFRRHEVLLLAQEMSTSESDFIIYSQLQNR